MPFTEEKPIYLQVAEQIEDAILAGAFAEEQQVPSTTEISARYRINPATALKGINLLVDAGILYKKRGLGMFVTKGAPQTIKEARKQAFFQTYIGGLIEEAQKLGLSKDQLIDMIERGYGA